MPNFPPYSNAQLAGDASQRLGESLNNTMLGIAQLRYNQGLQQQQMGLRAYDIFSEDALRRAQMEHLMQQAMVERRKAEAAARIEELAGLVGSYRQQRMNYGQGLDPSIPAELLARESGALAHIAASDPNSAERLLTGGHSVGQNDIWYGNMGQQDVGPVVLGQDAMYQAPGGPVLRNPGRVSLPPRYQSYDPTNLGAPPLFNPNYGSVGGQAGEILSKNNALTARMNPYFEEQPPWLQQAVDSALTNAAPDTAVAPPNLPPPPAPTLASRKAARANALAREHPDWSKEKIIQAVNNEMGP